MKKINVSFEVPPEVYEFIKMRAKMQEQSRSGYLRSLVRWDQAAWESVAAEQWEKWQQPVDNIGVSNGA